VGRQSLIACGTMLAGLPEPDPLNWVLNPKVAHRSKRIGLSLTVDRGRTHAGADAILKGAQRRSRDQKPKGAHGRGYNARRRPTGVRQRRARHPGGGPVRSPDYLGGTQTTEDLHRRTPFVLARGGSIGKKNRPRSQKGGRGQGDLERLRSRRHGHDPPPALHQHRHHLIQASVTSLVPRNPKGTAGVLPAP